jgi:hypothetical protein
MLRAEARAPASHVPVLLTALTPPLFFLKAIAEVMHTEEAYAIDLGALDELLLQPMHVCFVNHSNCGEACHHSSLPDFFSHV